MTATTYELRTARGRPVFAYDDETRARQERIKAEQRIGIKMELWRVDRVEERMA